MNKSNSLHELFTSEVPLLVGPEWLNLALGCDSLVAFQKIKDIEIEIGQEHSEYICSQMAKAVAENNGLEGLRYIFTDLGRFDCKLTIEQYLFSSFTFKAAAGRRINPSLFANGLSDTSIFDLRCFAGLPKHQSSLHFDWNPYPNLLLNLFGTKKIMLIAPNHSQRLGGYFNFSLHASEAELLKDKIEITLNPGEGILIPVFWWHQAFYQEKACSLSLRFKETNSIENYTTKLYPSWKIVELYSKNKEKGIRTISSVVDQMDPNITAKERFHIIEEVLNSKLGISARNDHSHYALWSQAYLHKKYFSPA